MSLSNPRPIPEEVRYRVRAYGFKPDKPKGRFVAETIMEIEDLKAEVQRLRGSSYGSYSVPITGGPWPRHVEEHFRKIGFL